MIRKWLERRRRRQQQEEYRRGYGWAWSAYMVERQPLDHIEALCSIPIPYIEETDYFDRGAQAAVADIEALDIVQEAA